MILKILRDILSIIGGLFCKLALYIYQSPHERRVAQWYRDDGDKTHRLNYDLNKDSIVFDLGGYEGQWSSDIYGMYCCNIFIFEVVPEYAMHISKRFEKNEKVKIFN